ncbi:hypothetical protein PR202_ga30021 [Eleusine coracana subsp. coracana]|uniref:non-specific serine/threonine protein kinase n=1 Tax=Eleusine coracana subsp. coracana TaxID=191504 RepID=A0AAV5DMA7_ELECO|nr:hypothetical protein PR202_ga30006 [Eleusine coracana subsp. coracana]GJN11798.1 hypothetical protein PR202_ga30021 [Eleusine coracana subsp. coracana]
MGSTRSSTLASTEDLSLDGGARIMPSGLLELTDGTVRQKGYAFHPSPLLFHEPSIGKVQSFSVSFVFAILSTNPESGHGLAFFIAPKKNFSGAFPTQYMGLFNNHTNGDPNSHIFAVELDTIQNYDMRDINGNHVGININSLRSMQSFDAGYYDNNSGIFKKLTLASHKAMQVWVSYTRETTQVDVTMAPLDVAKPILAISVPIAIVVLLAAVSATIFVHVWRNRRYSELSDDWEVEYGPHRFSYKDLFDATEGFNDKNLLGTGGFGMVYKGLLPISRLEVAVKRVSHDSNQGMKEFIAEIVSIGHVQHRNLVHLLGYCRRKDELLLVYDYMPNGSVDQYLYGKEGKTTLDWTQRFQIIKGVASGLLYLHEECEKVIIHRDIKASNVLLDNEINGRIGDFGLARLYDHGVNPETTHVVGTFGYIAPELARTGKATPLTDVFAFGMFILEVTCGQRPIRQHTEHTEILLVDWVLEHWNKGSLIDTVDIRLQGEYDVDEACLALKLGLLCSHPVTYARPSMRQAMQYLNKEFPTPELTRTHLSFSTLALMQNDEFINPYKISQSSMKTSLSTISSLSGGR